MSPWTVTNAVQLVRSTGASLSRITSVLPSTAPPITRPWPSRNFVAEWITRSAPCSIGRCSAGVQKQLSTTSSAPRDAAIAFSAAMSAISAVGFDGVST